MALQQAKHATATSARKAAGPKKRPSKGAAQKKDKAEVDAAASKASEKKGQAKKAEAMMAALIGPVSSAAGVGAVSGLSGLWGGIAQKPQPSTQGTSNKNNTPPSALFSSTGETTTPEGGDKIQDATAHEKTVGLSLDFLNSNHVKVGVSGKQPGEIHLHRVSEDKWILKKVDSHLLDNPSLRRLFGLHRDQHHVLDDPTLPIEAIQLINAASKGQIRSNIRKETPALKLPHGFSVHRVHYSRREEEGPNGSNGAPSSDSTPKSKWWRNFLKV